MIEDIDAHLRAKAKGIRFPIAIEALFDEKRRSYLAKALIESVVPSIACYNVFLLADWILLPRTF